MVVRVVVTSAHVPTTHSAFFCALNFTLRQAFEFRAHRFTHNKGKLRCIPHNVPCAPPHNNKYNMASLQPPPMASDDHAPKTARIQMTFDYDCNGDGSC